jgi:uncharacterized RDD family membrane protein YckC
MSATPEAPRRLDTRYAAETPEGIALSLRPAGIVPRFYAYLVDLGVRFVVFFFAMLLLAQLGRFGAGILLVVLFLLEWLYPVVFELGPRRGDARQAHGRTHRRHGQRLPVTPAASLTRNLLRAADFLPSFYALGALAMLWRHDFKRLGDLAAGTLVVHAERAGPRPAAPPPAPARAPAVPLPAAAQAAIVAWAGRVPRLTEARADELAEIAVPVVAPRAMHGDRVAALVGVAHWLLGRR